MLSPANAPPPDDLAACLAIDWWTVAFVAVALPLSLLACMETGSARQQAHGWNQRQQQPGHPHELLLCIYLYSAMVWMLCVQLGPLVWPLLPPLA